MRIGLGLSAVFCLALLAISPAVADTQAACKAATEKEIAALFDRWNASLRTLDPEAVVRNYADDAVLLPTVSDKPRLTQKERKDYFIHFLENKPTGEINMRVIKIGCNDAIDVGLYTFTFGNGNKVAARYTFTYEWRDGKWLISTHHSSKMPEGGT